jgi:hypothetical protein
MHFLMFRYCTCTVQKHRGEPEHGGSRDWRPCSLVHDHELPSSAYSHAKPAPNTPPRRHNGATDNTRYGEGAASPHSFLKISTAIQAADAQTILNAAGE